MKVRRASLLLTLLALSVMAASAADITGKWVAQMPGRDGGTQETTFVFKMEGGKLTGSMTTGQRETAITEGQVTGDAISFVVVQSRGGTDMKNIYKGTVSGTEMKLTRSREGGGGGGGRGGQAREIVAKKVG
jgi:uncharacterized protein (DUF2141 family)